MPIDEISSVISLGQFSSGGVAELAIVPTHTELHPVIVMDVHDVTEDRTRTRMCLQFGVSLQQCPTQLILALSNRVRSH